MEAIQLVWFDESRIYIRTIDGNEYSRPLEAFPLLKAASEEERMNYKIGRFGDDIRWECIDEDIHISSFFIQQEPEPKNEVAEIFAEFPWLNISEVAKCIGINKTLLSSYIYGMKKPSDERLELIKQTLHEMGQKLMAV